MTTAIANLNILKLPSLDLRRNKGWGVVSGLPSAPGCYMVVAYFQKKQRNTLTYADRVKVANYAKSLLGKPVVDIAQVVAKGHPAAVTLYIGYSKNLYRRWNGSTAHHKAKDLKHVISVLSGLFELSGLRMHFFTCPTGKNAKFLETELIRLWNPVTNGMGEIVQS